MELIDSRPNSQTTIFLTIQGNPRWKVYILVWDVRDVVLDLLCVHEDLKHSHERAVIIIFKVVSFGELTYSRLSQNPAHTF